MCTVGDILSLFNIVKYVYVVDVFGGIIYSGFNGDMNDYVCNMKVIGFYMYPNKSLKITVCD